MKSDPRISVIGTAHAEKPQWLRRAIRSVTMQQDAPDYELIVVMDNPSPGVIEEVNAAQSRGEVHGVVTVSNGDLGASRNAGVAAARGKYVSFLDLDDAFGARWLRQAYDYAREIENTRSRETDPDKIGTDGTEDGSLRRAYIESFVLHPEYNVFFGARNFMHRHISDDSPEFDAKDMISFNAWSALAFGPRSVFERFPYRKATGGYGYEDHMFNTETLGASIAHRVVPASAHMIRMKIDDTSLAKQHVVTNRVIPRMALFDRRDLQDSNAKFDEQRVIPEAVYDQVVFAHKEVGERQIMLSQKMTIRLYPRQRIWTDHAWLRDQIGDAKRVVLVDTLRQGGAEKYAIDFAAAVGAVIVETQPNDGAWRARAAAAGVRVITWTPIRRDLNEAERNAALQRALIQCELDTLLVCNSQMGWMLLHENAEVLARQVLAASFAPIPAGHGMEICPPYFLKRIPENLSILTDNEAHADRLREYNGARVHVLPPKVAYDGPSKRKQIKTDKLRVLWAGRGSPEKNPGILPALAAVLEDKADIHVWGDVKPMNGPENLKYRGPFDGFDKIDGTYDVYLITSLTEGCPNTAMEAVMADIPVVGPEIGALPELVTMHYRGDVTAIAQAILHAGAKYTAGPKLTVMKWRDNFDDGACMLVTDRVVIPAGAKFEIAEAAQ